MKQRARKKENKNRLGFNKVNNFKRLEKKGRPDKTRGRKMNKMRIL